jgi:hypothetical protein
MVLILTVVRYKNLPPMHPLSARIGDAGGTIGRSADNDLVLPDPKRWVSGHHAAIRFRDGKFFLTDISTNGTHVNHAPEPVPEGQQVELHDGDELSIGAYDVRVAITAAPRAGAPGDPFARGEPEQAAAPGHPPSEPAPDILDFVREKPSVLGPAHEPGAPESEIPPINPDDWLRPAPQETEPDRFAPPQRPGKPHEIPTKPDDTPEDNVFFTPPNAIPDDYDIWSDQAKPASEPPAPKAPELPPAEPEPPPPPPALAVPEPGPPRDRKPSPMIQTGERIPGPVDLAVGLLRRSIRAALADLRRGRILFNPPERMKIGKREKVEVRISGSLEVSPEDLAKNLTGQGKIETEEIKVGSFMSVRLTGSAFEIVSVSHEGQFVPEDGFAEWQWNVTPQKSGQQTLYLAATVRLKIPPFGEEVMDLPVFEKTIYVAVARIAAITQFLQNHWQWIATAILFPLIAWAAKFLWP